MERHDVIHLLLGRGLTTQDEAFVIGFTMGCDSKVTDYDYETFIHVSVNEYPEPWNFSESDIISYKLGFGYAKEHHSGIDIHLEPLEEMMHFNLKGLREKYKFNMNELVAYYNIEKLLNPTSSSSTRLN